MPAHHEVLESFIVFKSLNPIIQAPGQGRLFCSDNTDPREPELSNRHRTVRQYNAPVRKHTFWHRLVEQEIWPWKNEKYDVLSITWEQFLLSHSALLGQQESRGIGARSPVGHFWSFLGWFKHSEKWCFCRTGNRKMKMNIPSEDRICLGSVATGKSLWKGSSRPRAQGQDRHSGKTGKIFLEDIKLGTRFWLLEKHLHLQWLQGLHLQYDVVYQYVSLPIQVEFRQHCRLNICT